MLPTRSRTTLPLVLWLAGFAGAAGLGAAPGEPAQAPVRTGAPLGWEELVERDRRVSFTRLSSAAGVEVLGRSGQSEQVRAAALMALGASGDRSQRDRLESWVHEGAFQEKQAALLALGELGATGSAVVHRLAGGASPQLAGCAQLALLRGDARAGTVNGRATVASVAEDDSHPLRDLARDLLAAPGETGVGPETVPGRLLLELRWDAARRFGLIDGLAWSVRLERDLAEDEAFLDRIVYEAASELGRPGVADHFLEIALEPGPAVRLRGVVNAIPAELDQLVAANLWLPADAAEWAQLVFAIDERRLEGLTDTLLRGARVVPDLSAYGSALLVRGGNPDGLPLLELDLNSPVSEVRARIAETMGGTGEERFIELLHPLLSDPDAGVRASALIAHYRLGDPAAREALRRGLAQPDAPDHRELVERSCRVATDARVRVLLNEHVNQLTGEERLSAAVALTHAGDPVDRETLRAAVRGLPPGAAVRADVIGALAEGASFEDIELLRELYPREGDREANVALVLGLVRLRDRESLPVLRSALWREPWNRSVLAGALILDVGGIEALRAELQRPPRDAVHADLRRVGFALGEWGGVPEVERLAQRRSAADPAVQGALLGALGARTHQ